jgi:hypothetical protein
MRRLHRASPSADGRTPKRVSLTTQETPPHIARQRSFVTPTLDVRRGSLRQALSDAEVFFDRQWMHEG